MNRTLCWCWCRVGLIQIHTEILWPIVRLVSFAHSWMYWVFKLTRKLLNFYITLPYWVWQQNIIVFTWKRDNILLITSQLTWNFIKYILDVFKFEMNTTTPSHKTYFRWKEMPMQQSCEVVSPYYYKVNILFLTL